MEETFTPKPWARNCHIQSICASLKVRARGPNPMADRAREVIIDGGDGVRLLGFHSTHGTGGKGLILLIHGWEGSADSTYILHTGRYLYARGYDIFRLNLRDHGSSHHLNEGIFHGGLIDEVFSAARTIAGRAGERPCAIVGFSLGGNFALRIALRHSRTPIENLRQVIAISTILDPLQSTRLIDSSLSIYRNYFLKKWKRSLAIKERLFPHIYDFTDIMKMKTVMDMTDGIIERYSPFPNHRDYFSTYTLRREDFADLSVPVTVIVSRDDPFIAVEDFYALEGTKNLHLSIQRYGGHCGFIDPFPRGCWFEGEIERIMKRYAEKNDI